MKVSVLRAAVKPLAEVSGEAIKPLKTRNVGPSSQDEAAVVKLSKAVGIAKQDIAPGYGEGRILTASPSAQEARPNSASPLGIVPIGDDSGSGGSGNNDTGNQDRATLDPNGDGRVDLEDLSRFMSAYGTTQRWADYDRSGKVDDVDLQKFLASFGQS